MDISSATVSLPAGTAICWVQRGELYVQYPMKDPSLPPCIVRYKATAMNLAKALSVLVDYPAQDQPILGYSKELPRHPAAKVAPKSKFSEDQLDSARALLKKMGVV